jgi:tRNA threonylcarbamoyladenosine biosynthesis protein TsaE
MSIFLKDEDATLVFGASLAKQCVPGLTIYLHGDLGAGKTTLVRGLIQHFLPGAKVKSPTYTLVEDYEFAASATTGAVQYIHHFDLYRLGDPEELEYLGGRDYFNGEAVCLVEWPERGEGWLAQPDLEITLNYQSEGRSVDCLSHSDKGREIINQLNMST